MPNLVETGSNTFYAKCSICDKIFEGDQRTVALQTKLHSKIVHKSMSSVLKMKYAKDNKKDPIKAFNTRNTTIGDLLEIA